MLRVFVPEDPVGTTRGRRFLSRIPNSESFLIGILCLIGLIPWPTTHVKRRGRPYLYPPTVMLRCFIARMWPRIPSNNALHSFLSIDSRYNSRIMLACGLSRVPDRRTFDRRFKATSLGLRSRIGSMGELFVDEKFIDPYVVSVDSSLLKAKGHVWHKTSMEKGVVYYSGIDTDARWGKSRPRGGSSGTSYTS